MKIHCIGIGGIGLSALARYYKSEGHEVSGSDANSSELIETLQKEGIYISIGHSKNNIPSFVDRVIYTIAIKEDNEELLEAKNRNTIIKTYPEALGDITKEKITIAICGTHGKTTTTAMTYYALKSCGVNPTVIIGSILSEHGTNFIKGDSNYLVVEACEYKRSFLNLHPTYVIVTNIDNDHLDYYKDISDIKDAFNSFVNKVPIHGFISTHQDVSFPNTLGTQIQTKENDGDDIVLSVLGRHNKRNASLVLNLLKKLNFKEENIRKGLEDFPGTWRRMEYKGKTIHNVSVYDDYGHHPKEIEVTLEALREKYSYDDYHLIVFFQPHLYSRTKIFLDEFASVLKKVDEVYILPIYQARKEDTIIVSENDLINKINKEGGNAKFLELEKIADTISSLRNSRIVVLNIGAGNAFMELQKVQLV